MLRHQNPIHINAPTTGFASPAETYVDKRLDLNDLIVKDHYTTFYFKYSGPTVFGINQDYITQKYTTSWNELPLVFI